MPHARPPPPYGTTTVSNSSRSSASSRPIVPLPAMTASSANGVHEQPLHRRVPPRREHVEPLVDRDLQDLPTEPAGGAELRLRRSLGHHDRARHAELARAPGDALRHVPGARRPEAVADEFGIGHEHGVRGTAQLEGADGLEQLELEPDLRGRLGVEPDERRGTTTSRMRSRAASISASGIGCTGAPRGSA